MRIVSLRCRGYVISVADYNEQRYGLHVIRFARDIIRIADFIAPNTGCHICLLIALSNINSSRSETKIKVNY